MENKEIAENLEFILSANMVKALGAEYNELIESVSSVAVIICKVESGQLVDVVRCKECRDYWKEKCINADSGYFEWKRDKNDYCCDGEQAQKAFEREDE